MFSELFGMGIETILFSFIADEEMYKVEDRFAEGELMSTIQKTAQAHKMLKAGTKVHQVQVSPTKVISYLQVYQNKLLNFRIIYLFAILVVNEIVHQIVFLFSALGGRRSRSRQGGVEARRNCFLISFRLVWLETQSGCKENYY